MELKLITLLFSVIGVLNAATLRSSSYEDGTREVLNDLCRKTREEVSIEAPGLFQELVKSLARLDDATTKRLWREVKSGQFCRETDKLQDFFRDALINDGSGSSIQQLVELMESGEMSDAQVAYATMMLTFTKEPNRESVRAILPLLKKRDASRQTLLGLSGLIHNFCRKTQVNCESMQEVQEAAQTIARHLGSRCRASNSDEEAKIVVALKALKNIGQVGSVADTLLACAEDKSNKNKIRREAVRAVGGAIPANERVARRVMDILEDRKNDPEVRIFAYGALMRNQANWNTLNRIKEILQKEDNKQVGSYIQSSLKNIKKSSDPAKKQLGDLIRSIDFPEDKFPQNWQKYSRNYEMSQVYGQIGPVVEANLIYTKKSALPKAANLKIKLPVYGETYPILGIATRHVNVHALTENIAKTAKNWMDKTPSQMMEDLVKAFSEDGNRRSALWNSINTGNGESFDGSVSICLDGKTVLYLEADDFSSKNIHSVKQLAQAVSRSLEQLVKTLSKDKSFSVNFIDINKRIQKDNSEVELDVNGTLVLGFNGKGNSMSPSLAVQMSTRVGPDARNNKPGVKIVQTLYSGASWQHHLIYKNDVPVKMIVKMPVDKSTLFKFQTEVFEITPNNREREVRARSSGKEYCATSDVFRVKVCGQFSKPNELINSNTPIIPLNGPINIEAFLEKTDRSMEGWELELELPNSRQSKFLIGFNTPGSRKNMEHQLSIEARQKMVTVQVKSPRENIEASANYDWTNEMAFIKGQISRNQRQAYSVNAEIKKLQNGRQVVYKPRFELQGLTQDTLHLEGSIAVDSPRAQKPKIAIELRSNTDRDLYLRGELIKDGPFNSRQFKLSTNLEGAIKVMKFRTFGTVQKNERHGSADLSVSYQKPGRQEQEAKFNFNFNDNASSRRKISSNFEFKNTQNPEINFQVMQNLQLSSEMFDSQVVFKWRGNFQDERKQMRFHQTWKSDASHNSLQSLVQLKHWDWEMENKIEDLLIRNRDQIQAEIKLENRYQHGRRQFHYEVGANANYKSQDPQLKVEVYSNNKMSSRNTNANFEFKYLSRKPLRISLDAALQLPHHRYTYSDQLQEVRPNEIKGRSEVQWAPNKKTTLEYNYRIKNDNQKNQHEVDLTLQTPSTNIQHSAMLRMARSEFGVRSKHVHNYQEIYNLDATLSPSEKSALNFNSQGYMVNLEGTSNRYSKQASLSLKSNNHQLEHNTEVQYQPGVFSLHSKTLKNQQNIYTLSANHNQQGSVLNLNTMRTQAKVDFHPRASPKTLTIDISHPKYSHSSRMAANGDSWTIKSKTRNMDSDLLTVNGKISRRSPSNLEISGLGWMANAESNWNPRSKTLKIAVNNPSKAINHLSRFASEPHMFTAESSTKQSGRELFALKSKYDPSREHILVVDIPKSRSGIDINIKPRQNALVSFRNKNNMHKLSIQSVNNEFLGDYEATNRNRQWAKASGKFSPRSTSEFQVVVPSTGSLNLQVTPGRQAKWEIKKGGPRPSSNDLLHSSSIIAQDKGMSIFSQTEQNQKKWLLDASLNQYGPSHLNVHGPMYETELSADANAPVKSAKVIFKRKINPFVHETEATYQPGKVMWNSQLRRQGNTYRLDAVLSDHEPSKLNFNGHATTLKAQVNPIGKAKSFSFEMSSPRGQVRHDSALATERNRLTITSKTDLNGKNLYDLSTKLSKKQLSQLTIRVPQGSAIAEFEPRRSGKLEIKTQNYVHRTAISNRPDHVAFDSETSKNNNPLAIVSGQISARSQSKAEIRLPQGKANVRVNPWNELEVSFDGQGLTHSTYIRKQNTLIVKSNSARQGQNIYNLDLDLHPTKSQAQLEMERADISGGFQTGPIKNARILIKSKDRRNPFTHQSEAVYRPGKLTINSQQKGRRSLTYTLDTTLTNQDQSNFKLAAPVGFLNIQVTPGRQAKWEIKKGGSRPSSSDWSHSSSIIGQNNGMTIFSQTEKNQNKWLLDANLNRNGPSRVNMNGPMYETELSADAYAPVKSAKVVFKRKVDPFTHETEATYQPGRVMWNSQMQKQGKTYRLDALLSDREPSTINFNGHSTTLKAQVNPIGSTKSFNFDMSSPRSQVSHASALTTERRRMTITSKTDLNGDNLYDTKFRVVPWQEAEFDMNTKNVRHHTTLKNGDTVSFISQTNAHGKQYNADGSFHYSQSMLKINTPTHKFNGQLSNGQAKSLSFDLSSPRVQVRHDSAFNSERRRLTMTSKTDLNGHNLYNAKLGILPWQEADLDVNTKNIQHRTSVKNGDVVSFDSQTNAFGNQYNVDGNLHYSQSSLKINTPNHKFAGQLSRGKRQSVDLSYNDLKHLTEVIMEPQTMQFNSKTVRRGQNLLDFESMWAPSSTSYIRIAHPDHESGIELNLKPEIVGKLNFRSKQTPYSHVTIAKYRPGNLDIDSNTQTARRKSYKIQSVLTHDSASNLNIECPDGQVKATVSPFGASKFVSLNVNHRNIKLNHMSDMTASNKKYLVTSKTDYNGNKVYEFTADLDSTHPSISGDSPYLSGRIEADNQLNDKRLSINVKSKLPRERHILGMVRTASRGQRSEIESSLAWDNSRDSSKKVSFSGSLETKSIGWGKKNAKAQIQAALGNSYTYSAQADLASNLIAGPHSMSANARTPYGRYNLEGSHQSNRGNTNCKFELLKDGRSVALLDTRLSPKSRSQINVKAPVGSMLAEYDQEQALLKLDNDVYQHQTTVSKRGNVINVESETKQYRRPIATVSGYYAPGAESRAQIRYHQANALLRMTPWKMMEVDVNSQQVKHNTLIRHERQSTDISSKTEISGKKVAEIEGKFDDQHSNFKVLSQDKRVEYDYTKGRQASLDVEGFDFKRKAESVMHQLTKKMKKSCNYYSTCYQLAHSYERQGWKGASQKAYQIAEEKYNQAQKTVTNWWNKRLPALTNNVIMSFEEVAHKAQKWLNPSKWIDQIPNFRSEPNKFKVLFDLRK